MIAPLPIPFPSGNSILASANRHYDEPEFIHQVLSGAKTDDKSTVVEDSVPRVAKLDSNGVPIKTEQESTTKDQIEVLQWQMWKEKQGKANTNLNAKALAFSALYLLDDGGKQIPVAMCRRNGKEVYCKAKTDIDIGDLQIPLTMKFMNSLVTVASQDEMKHPIAVPLEVSWQVTDLEKKAGGGARQSYSPFQGRARIQLAKTRGGGEGAGVDATASGSLVLGHPTAGALRGSLELRDPVQARSASYDRGGRGKITDLDTRKG